MKHLETFEAAAKAQGIDPTKLPDVSMLSEALGKATIAAYKLFVISHAAWNGVKIDWNNYNQYKYYPWFDMETYEDQVGSFIERKYAVEDKMDRCTQGDFDREIRLNRSGWEVFLRTPVPDAVLSDPYPASFGRD